MRDLLANGAAWLASQQASHMAQPMTYQRGASSVRVSATRGLSRFDVPDAEGMMVRVETLDFIIPVGELALDGVATEPATGDRIFDGALGEAIIYEVMELPGEPPWRFTDPHRTQYRIHAKQVDDQRN